MTHAAHPSPAPESPAPESPELESRAPELPSTSTSAFDHDSGSGYALAPPRLFAERMSKRFGDLVALDDVSFTLRPGSVHALLGENGAGKSTLVKCIMGFYRADRGRVLVGDTEAHVANPKDARAFGIGMVYQHFTLVENMTVAENLVLARARLPAIIDWKAEHAAIDAFMQRMPFQIAPGRSVRQLAAGEKQKLEILKQLYLNSRIIILDEPTSVLTPQEADGVLGMLRGLVEAGQLSVAIITHKFREVKAFADEVTVLRRGRFAGSGLASALSTRELAEMMVGAEPSAVALTRTERPRPSSAPKLQITDLHASDDIGLPILRGIQLAVHAGEIVGVAGVSGNGQDELVEVLAGQRPANRGHLQVSGQTYAPVRAQMRRERVRLLPEAPLRNACVPQMSVAENIAFRSFDAAPYCKGWWLRKSKLRERALAAIRDFSIKAPSAETPIGSLSGGNVQRAVLARELGDEAAILIAANPCFGLDFSAVSEIHQRILRAREAGTAVLLVSADLDEIFALADRIVVMSEGRIVHECDAKNANLTEIGQHMAGHAGVDAGH